MCHALLQCVAHSVISVNVHVIRGKFFLRSFAFFADMFKTKRSGQESGPTFFFSVFFLPSVAWFDSPP